MKYLTGVSSRAITDRARELGLGLLITPGTAHYATNQLAHYDTWAADNGCFAQGAAFNTDRYLDWLTTLAPDRRADCLFAVAPDHVGDALLTWARCVDTLDAIRAIGYRAALVTQNGLGYDEDTDRLYVYRHTTDWTWSGIAIDWTAFDVLFIGGDDHHKVWSPRTWALIRAARAHNTPVHMGRVNSEQRWDYARELGCTSADGTFLAFGPAANLPRLAAWRTVA